MERSFAFSVSPFHCQACKSIVKCDELVAIDTWSTPHVRRSQSSDTSRNRACAAITKETVDTKMLQAAVDLRRLLGVGVAGREGCQSGCAFGAEIDGLHKVLFKIACTWRDLASALEEEQVEEDSSANITCKLDAAIRGFNELTGYVVGTLDTQVCHAHAVIALLTHQPLLLDRLPKLMQVRACVLWLGVTSNTPEINAGVPGNIDIESPRSSL